MDTYDVGIIGAGVHGASAAFHLAARGAATVVFERGRPAGGPTGRSSAVCRAYYTNDFLARVARESLDMFADWDRVVGGDAGFHRLGALYLHPPEDEGPVRDASAAMNVIGTVCEVLEPSQVAERFPAFDLADVGIAVWERDAGYADPAGTTESLLRRAMEQGVTARLGTEVTGLELRGDGGVEVVADDGTRTRCRRVLVAAGPWTGRLAALAGADLPITVERHVVATFGWGSAPPAPLHAHVPGGYYLKPEGDELFLVGPLHPEPQADPDRFDERLGEAESERLAAAFTRRIPSLEAVEPRGGWASLYDVSPDWQPVIGEVAPGVVVDCGTSGHGFKLAPALGRHVAALMLGDDVPGIEQFHPRRFEERHALSAGFGEARILG